MNYTRIHNLIITKAKTRKLHGYSESHHIVPKCMGGTNERSNLVNLTAKEHFLIHRLLCKIYPNNNKLKFAAVMMTRSSKHTIRSGVSYERVKKLNSQALSVLHKGSKRSEEFKKNLSVKT